MVARCHLRNLRTAVRLFKGPSLPLSIPAGHLHFFGGAVGVGPDRPTDRPLFVRPCPSSSRFTAERIVRKRSLTSVRLSVHPSIEQSSSKKSEIEISKLKTNPGREREGILILWLPLSHLLCLCHPSVSLSLLEVGFCFAMCRRRCRLPSIIRLHLPHAEQGEWAA